MNKLKKHILLLLILVNLSGCAAFTSLLGSFLAPEAIYSFDCKNKVALTIDDGPSKYTDLILDVLDKYKVPATFFIIGSNAEVFPENFQKISLSRKNYPAELRHELANHTYLPTYSKEVVEESPEKFYWSLKKNHQLLSQFNEVKWFRPGGGLYNKTILGMLSNYQVEKKYNVLGLSDNDKFNYQIVLGNVYSMDYAIENVQFHEWVLNNFTKAGSIIVLHDYGSNGKLTAKVLDKVIPWLQQEKKFKFVTLSELSDCNSK